MDGYQAQPDPTRGRTILHRQAVLTSDGLGLLSSECAFMVHRAYRVDVSRIRANHGDQESGDVPAMMRVGALRGGNTRQLS